MLSRRRTPAYCRRPQAALRREVVPRYAVRMSGQIEEMRSWSLSWRSSTRLCSLPSDQLIPNRTSRRRNRVRPRPHCAKRFTPLNRDLANLLVDCRRCVCGQLDRVVAGSGIASPRCICAARIEAWLRRFEQRNMRSRLGAQTRKPSAATRRPSGRPWRACGPSSGRCRAQPSLRLAPWPSPCRAPRASC